MSYKIYDIPGGIHPPANKQQSLQLPLGEVDIPPEIILPLNQHIGTPASPMVEVGEKVLTGQLIAEATGPISVPVHASASGRIIAIESRPVAHPSGIDEECIVIETDGKDNWVELEPCENYRDIETEVLVERLHLAGLAGLGGAGFPAAVKMSPRPHHPIDTLILNGTECEPYITADDLLMQLRPDEIIAGTELLVHLLGSPSNILVGIEDNKPQAIQAMEEAAKQSKLKIEVISFPTKYPSGGEKQLIQILTGKEVPTKSIPASIGIVVQNVATAAAAWRAVRYGEPLIKRITTVVGEALQVQRNVEVRLGTPIDYLLEQQGFQAEKSQRLIMGGPMMGFSILDHRSPVVKTTNCILAPSAAEMPLPPPAQACIRCGLCAEACPAELLPQQLYWYAKAEDYERVQAHNLFDCIECGACSYVCPSRIPLVQYYRAAKGIIRQADTEKQKSDHARQRFEFRKERLAKAEAEKEAKRAARRKAAEQAKRKLAQEPTANKTATSAPVNQPTQDQTIRKQPSFEEQKAKLERALNSATSRLEKNRRRLAEAEDLAQQEKLAALVKQTEVKVKDAQQKLQAFVANSEASEA